MSSTVKLRVGILQANGELEPGSMALAIEQAMVAQVPYGPDEDPHARRRFAMAVAQGVIDHLVANPGAIMTRVRNLTNSSTHLQPAESIDRW